MSIYRVKREGNAKEFQVIVAKGSYLRL